MSLTCTMRSKKWERERSYSKTQRKPGTLKGWLEGFGGQEWVCGSSWQCQKKMGSSADPQH